MNYLSMETANVINFHSLARQLNMPSRELFAAMFPEAKYEWYEYETFIRVSWFARCHDTGYGEESNNFWRTEVINIIENLGYELTDYIYFVF